MMIHDQTATTSLEHAALDVPSTLAECTDDAVQRIRQYQQQLRTELIAAASGEADRPSSRWGWLPSTPTWPGQTLTALRAIESRVKGLTETGAGYAYRQAYGG